MTQQKTVSLNPSESEEVTFQVIPTEIGDYTISVNGLSGGFTALSDVMDIPLSVQVSFEADYYYRDGYLIWQGGTLSIYAENPDSSFADWAYDAGSPGGAIGYSAEKYPGSTGRRTGALVGYFDPTNLAHGGSQSWSVHLHAGQFMMGIAMSVNVHFSARMNYAGQTVRLVGNGWDSVVLNI